MRGGAGVTAATRAFLAEHLRAPVIVALLLVLPALFVGLASDVLSEFASALGGALAGNAAAALGAGWAVAFLTGAVAYFQTASSRGADRRLALAGLGALRVAGSRMTASLLLAGLITAVAYLTLWVVSGIQHPLHAAAALAAFSMVYLAVGSVAGVLFRDPLEGSLAVAFLFMLDVFSGPGMGRAAGIPTPTREAGELLIAAGAGMSSSPRGWASAGLIALGGMLLALCVFWSSARSRA